MNDSCVFYNFLVFLDQTGKYTWVMYPVNSNYSFLWFGQSITLMADTPIAKISAALTLWISFLFGTVIFCPAHLNLDQRANYATSVLGQVPGTQNLPKRGRRMQVRPLYLTPPISAHEFQHFAHFPSTILLQVLEKLLPSFGCFGWYQERLGHGIS